MSLSESIPRASLMVSVNVTACKICRSVDCEHCNIKYCKCNFKNCICENVCVCHKPENCTCVECKCHNVDVENRTKPLKIGERLPDTPDFLAKMPEQAHKINEYFKEHKIHEFFHFLMCHLLAKMPDKPINFLLDLLDNLCNYAVSFDFEPPLLYEDKHIESLYNTMDPLGFECINYNQYYNGLITLGVNNFTTNPPLNEDQMISKEFFCSHAKQCLIVTLNDLLSFPANAKEEERKASDISDNSEFGSEKCNKSTVDHIHNNDSSQLKSM